MLWSTFFAAVVLASYVHAVPITGQGAVLTYSPCAVALADFLHLFPRLRRRKCNGQATGSRDPLTHPPPWSYRASQTTDMFRAPGVYIIHVVSIAMNDTRSFLTLSKSTWPSSYRHDLHLEVAVAIALSKSSLLG